MESITVKRPNTEMPVSVYESMLKIFIRLALKKKNNHKN